MAFEKTVPQWYAAGSEPPESLKQSGFTAGYKPPAAYFNWFWHSVSEALAELQNGTRNIAARGTLVASGANLNDYITPGDYCIPDAATATTITNTPMTLSGYKLIVEQGYGAVDNQFVQIAVGGNGPMLYVRQHTVSTGVWTTWRRLYDTYYPPTADEVGATNKFYGSVDGTAHTFNTALTQAEYSVAGTDIDGAPYTGDIYGKLVVLLNNGGTHNDSNNWIWQVFYCTKFGHLYIRNKVNNGAWSDWWTIYTQNNKPTPADIGAAASSHNQAASTITAGTFAGQVVANASAQTPATALLRNSKLVTSDTTPTNNGEICWTYE